MLFHSYLYICVLLPAALTGFILLGRTRKDWPVLLWLTTVSLVFFGWWNPRNLPVILGSILCNFSIATLLASTSNDRKPLRKALLVAGIAGNLATLGFFKYASFVATNAAILFGLDLPVLDVVLPLGISFFTFQQISFLVDTYRGETSRYSFLDYSLFVTFFPQLIAGPIVRHAQLIPQFHRPQRGTIRRDDALAGLAYFATGLCKKVVLSAVAARYADPVFAAATNDTSLSFAGAWIGVTAFSLQIYFDFSGYMDMAIGSARFFGIFLPFNFFSPYKAKDISQFWRRWHITLSDFFRDYLYIPLGGNRKGPLRQAVNGMITMSLVGLWHGAGWNFVLWGVLHGFYLVVFHFWHSVTRGLGTWKDTFLWSTAAGSLTFVAITVSWTLFRAETLPAAARLLQAMFTFDLPSMAPFSIIHNVILSSLLGCVALAIVLFLPNSHEWIDGARQPLSASGNFLPSVRHATFFRGLVIGTFITVSIMFMTHVEEFIYFQF